MQPKVQIGWNATSNAATDHLLATCTANEWNVYTYYITIPETFGDAATPVTGMYLFLRSSGSGTIYYDAVSLVKKDAGIMNVTKNNVLAPVSGETVTAFTTVAAGKSGTAIAALYKKNGEGRILVGVETVPVATAETAQLAAVNYTLPTMDAGEYTLAVYAWNMQSGIAPLKDAYTHTWTVQ